VLASDYLPTSLLAAVWLLARSGVATLPDAVGLVTAGPAAAFGLSDRGRIAPGRRADLLLVDDDQPWPLIRAVTTASGRYGRLDERSIA
jgi:alpha-D-ribose 1-methylphosphonate 5-triphosphate diphosphatase